MTTFIQPASNSPFDKLPAELATRTLDLAFAGRSRDVASCRLACQALHTLCSPYLIRTVVVAERLEALRKLREVMQHPYFSNYVTHLVWDASYYEYALATDYSRYENAFEQSEHLATSRDEAYVITRQTDAALLKDVQSHVHRHPRIPKSLRGTGNMLEYGLTPPRDDEQGYSLDSPWRDLSQPEDVLPRPNIGSSKLYRDSADFQDGNHMKGCHLGFADYYRLWENQNKVRGKHWQVDGNLARHYFFEAVRKLPKLRHLVHSDYRALAYNGESYAQLCQRLFNHTVCPTWSHVPEADSTADSSYADRFQAFLEYLPSTRGTWDSLSIGRHPFETNHHDSERHPPRNSGRRSVVLNYNPLMKQFSKDHGQSFMLNVRSLRLPLLTGGRTLITKLGGLSRLVTRNLTELDLGDYNFYRYWDHFKKTPQGAFGDGNPDRWFQELLLSDECKVLLGNLRSLSLCGFGFATGSLQALLLERMPALRTLHLIDCYCTDHYKHFLENMQQSIAPFTRLSGVEMFGIRLRQLEGETDDHEHAEEYHEKLQARRAHEYEEHPADSDEHFEGLLLSDWPYERPELEAAILGDRVNAVSRKMYAVPNDEARWNWQDHPCLDYS